MAPMIGVDLKALHDLGEQTGPDRDRLRLERRTLEHQAPAEIDHRQSESREGQAANPPIRGEGVDINVVRILAMEMVAKLERAEAERRLEQHLQRTQFGPEPAGFAEVIVLVKRSADLENFANRRNGQSDGEQDEEAQQPDDR